jgi:hypothetical protein
MLKDAVARTITLCTMLLTFAACSSCVSNSYLFGEGNLLRSKRRSFIKINTFRRAVVIKTSSTSPDQVEEEYRLEFKSTASGVILRHYREMSLIATSAHVCSIQHGMQVRAIIPEYRQNNPNWHLLERNNFVLRDLNGKSKTGIVIKIDYMSDLCIILTPKFNMPSANISVMDPLIGEKYYNVAAPHGIWGKQVVPLLEGRFVGRTKSPFTGGKTYMFTIPAAGGSSGSPIFNWYGDIVGLIHSAYGGFHHVSMAATNDQLHVLLSGGLMKINKHYKAYKVILSISN